MLYPIFAMFLLCFAVAFRYLTLLVPALKQGVIQRSDIAIGFTDRVPPKIKQASRHFSNLFEMPVFFYIVIIASMALHLEHAALYIFAWAYVALRIGHAYEHLTLNRLIIRRNWFMASNLVLLALWITVFILQHKMYTL